jgi:hypothetical protein
MSLSKDLMAAEAQLDAITAVGLPMRQSDTALLCRFLRECAVEAMALEAVVSQPFAGNPGADAAPLA